MNRPQTDTVDWPPVDVIVGNPPFLGGKKILGELGEEYTNRLRKHFKGRLPAFTDLVAFWFEKAREQIELGGAKRAGLLATNSLGMGTNLTVLKRIKETGDIFMAWSDRDWILDGAAVRVAMIGFDNGREQNRSLDGTAVRIINADLTSQADLTVADKLSSNQGLSFIGIQKSGKFDISNSRAREMIAAENESGYSNAKVIFPWINGVDIVQRTRDMYIIAFPSDMLKHEAAKFTLPFQHVVENVEPKRTAKHFRNYPFWIHWNTRPGLRTAIESLDRFIATPLVSKHRVFAWYEKPTLPSNLVVTIARDDDYFFGVLHSKLHEVWSLRMGTSLEDRPRYTPTTTFETFPFPWSPGAEDKSCAAHAAISAAARQLHEERDAWLNPNPPDEGCRGDLSSRPPPAPLSQAGNLPPVATGGPRGVKDRTLTNLYNALNVFRGRDSMKTKPAASDFAPRLDALHRALDEAVCDAYGWDHAVLDDEEEILRRLLALNLERAGG